MTSRNSPHLSARGGANLGAARQQTILAQINRGDVVSVSELADRFGVSLETIRRDIRVLEEAGQLRRVHGGAAPMRTVDLTAHRPVFERLDIDRDAKLLAARASMSMLEDGMSVYICTSSTMLLVGEEIARTEKRLTITTDMIGVATVTAASGLCEVTLLGGVVNPKRGGVGGYESLRSIEPRLFDLCVFGASAISPVHGVLGTSMASREIFEMVRSRSQLTAVVADGAKFGRRDSHVMLPLRDLDFLATDVPPPTQMAHALQDANVTVLLPDGVQLDGRGGAASAHGERQ